MKIILALYIVGVISFLLIANRHARSLLAVVIVALTWPAAVILFALEPRNRRNRPHG
jgi:uncharacterized membrane-anchored protein